MYVRRACRGGQRRAQPADEDEGRRRVAQLHLQQLQRIDLVDVLDPAVARVQVRHQATRVDRAAQRDPLGRGRPDGQRQRRQRLGRRASSARAPACARSTVCRAHARLDLAAEAAQAGQRAFGQRRALGFDQRRVGLGRAPDGLRGVVDQDVQRPSRADRVGERHDLRGVAQVDADDVQTIEPLAAVRHRREAPDRVVGKARRDRRLGAVAQQPQGDVHADLRPPAGQQRATAAQVGARLASLMVQRGARRAELVVERVDLHEARLADVTRARLLQGARRGPTRARDERQTPRLVVDPSGRARRRRRGHRAVVRQRSPHVVRRAAAA